MNKIQSKDQKFTCSGIWELIADDCWDWRYAIWEVAKQSEK